LFSTGRLEEKAATQFLRKALTELFDDASKKPKTID
jgi:hypothetical protein